MSSHPPQKRKRHSSAGTCVPRATFSRLVREIAADHKSGIKWSAAALRGLHEESEQFIGEHFSAARKLSERFKHRTVGVKHFNEGRAIANEAG